MSPHHPYPEAKSPQLVLLRHGETEWSRTGKHTGRTDIPLTAEGERRAAALEPVLAGRDFALVLASPRQRAVRTAELAGFAGRIETTEDLAEFDYGSYEGLTSPQIAEERPGWDLWRDGAPDGETAAEVRVRVERVIARAQRVLDDGRDVLLVAHGHVLRALGAAWIDLPPEGGSRLVLSTAGLAELGYEHGNRVIDLWNAA
ncbi:histidine phosphatase family protein [Amnibacterium kyonggiense]|uniref:Putative phosphoglycerate mutase n=1 Tax=Amnibacterium kyonggiense TaxID=595671 RepID=A0A4R7FKR4_9MICO|nr:histidine phosphatase family protein [Amnibacterium kyonggiense]TDS76981.1 putative phosphoglycerate mutase [Amnibacterium kyonggiense]